MGFPDNSIVQFDCIHVRPIVSSLLAIRLILREERSLEIPRPAPYIARPTAFTSRVECRLAQEARVRRLHEYTQAGYCSRYDRKAKFSLCENLGRSIIEDRLVARQRL
jgi:hypothetical protein